MKQRAATQAAIRKSLDGLSSSDDDDDDYY